MTKENCQYTMIIISSYSDHHVVIFCQTWLLHLSCTVHSRHSFVDIHHYHWACPIIHDQRLFGKESCRRSQFPPSSHGESRIIGESKLEEVTNVAFFTRFFFSCLWRSVRPVQSSWTSRTRVIWMMPGSTSGISSSSPCWALTLLNQVLIIRDSYSPMPFSNIATAITSSTI